MVKFRVKISGYLLQLLTLALLPCVVAGQSSDENRNIFTQAKTYYLYEEYELANQLFLLLDTPGNLNVKYKIGNCYLHIPGEKEKSISYLEQAVKNTSYDAKPDSYKETRAPLDAYFSLAKAYMINNELEKGLNTLESFRKLAGEAEAKGGMKNRNFIDQEIEACRNAIKLKENPLIFSKKILGKDFCQGAINENPAVSFDGSTLVYTERRGIANAIFCSRKEKGKWQTPVDVTHELVAGEDCSSCSLNRDGTELFIYKTGNYDGDIYSSLYKNGAWTPIRILNRNINTKFYESHAAISSDGKKLYFTSNREGGLGNLDIYVSEKDATGDWGPAVNLGAEINTPFNEDTPFITEDDSLIYFSSEGHSSMGGFDIFKSHKEVNSWGPPLNIGYPLNTTDDDKFFQPFKNGMNAFYTFTTGYKKRDIFYLILGGPGGEQFTEITGTVSLSDTVMSFDKTFRIHLIDRSSGDTTDVGYPNKFTGLYSFYVLPGQYSLVYTGVGYFPETVDTTIASSKNRHEIGIDVSLIRDPSTPRNPITYDKINLSAIPSINQVDTSTLIKNLNVTDLNDKNVKDSDILYFTVQVMALYKPVDVSYFKYINDIQVMYNEKDRFYRYTTGIFQVKEDAYALKSELIRKGYPDDLFVKKVSK